MDIQNLIHLNQDKINHYIDLLLYWQTKFNLIGNNTQEQIYSRHILDSAQLLPYIEGKNLKIADLGSGAGFPSLVLAILDSDNTYHLVESNYKKSVFLSVVKQELGLSNVNIQNCRIDSLALKEAESFDVVISRAMGHLKLLLEYAIILLKKDGYCLFPKGANAILEIQEAGDIIESNPTYYKIKFQNTHDVLINLITSLSNKNAHILSIKIIK